MIHKLRSLEFWVPLFIATIIILLGDLLVNPYGDYLRFPGMMAYLTASVLLLGMFPNDSSLPDLPVWFTDAAGLLLWTFIIYALFKNVKGAISPKPSENS